MACIWFIIFIPTINYKFLSLFINKIICNIRCQKGRRPRARVSAAGSAATKTKSKKSLLTSKIGNLNLRS